MPYTPTPSQEKALSRERHLAVVANAGSGKTQVLVARYLDILLTNPSLSPRNIAAITFTENAAAELRERIAKEIEERLITSAAADRTRLRQIRNALQSASITTIHGFASRILRAYPVEAGVDAQFGILHGPEREVLREDSIARVFYSTLEEAYQAPDDSLILRAFRRMNRKPMTNAVRVLLNNRMRAERLKHTLYGLSDTDVLERWYDALMSELSWIESDETRATLLALTPHFKSGKIGQKAQESVAAFAAARKADRIWAFWAVSDSFKSDGTLKAHVTSSDLDPEIQAKLDDLSKQLKETGKYLGILQDGKDAFFEVHREYLFLVRSVFEVYEAVLADYQLVKADYAQLDFDDLLILFEKLLDDSRIREELARQYPHILIDEYQDTDETQFEIARLLSLNFGSTTRLMVVGDPKQSIYRFRNADVEVFAETCAAIGRQALSEAASEDARLFGLNADEERGQLALRESFRMAKAPLAFVNSLLGLAMQDASIPYLDLVSAYPGSHDGTVTFMLENGVPDDEDEETLGKYERECQYVARKIRELVGRTTIETKTGEAIAGYNDVAILLRTRSRISELEDALQEWHVPYTVAKGSGFFVQQEVMDVISYLRFLVTPSDDIALAALLRSPFFGVSDQELFRISHASRFRGRTTTSFWEQMRSFPKDRRSVELHRAVEQLLSLLPLVGRTTTALLLERIYAVSGIVAALGCTQNGAQKIANIEKLLDMARESDRSGFSTLYDFVERLMYLQEKNEGEAQADISAGGNAVRIMTVHAAKGLEFPIVFLPFLGCATNNDSGAYLDKSLGLRLPGKAVDLPGITTLMDSYNAQAETAESLRLLYVALTRAKEHLYLTATHPNKRNRSWLTQMLSVMPSLLSDDDINIPTTIERYNADTGATTRLNYELFIRRETTDSKLEEFTEVPKPALPDVIDFHLETIPIVNPTGSFSATQFLTLRECPTKYYLRYVLGIPEEPRLETDLEPYESSERVRGPILGQLVHKLLEQLGKYASSTGFDEDNFELEALRIGKTLRPRSDEELDALVRAAREHVLNFVRSNLAHFVYTSDYTRAEFELELVLSSGDRLFGILDRVLQLPDGRFAVIDYKTDQLHEGNKQAKLMRYRLQLLLYAYLLSRYTGDDNIVGSLFFTLPDEKGQAEHFSYDFSASDLERLEEQLGEYIAIIRAMDSITTLEQIERNETHCSDCRYFSVDRGECVAATNPREVQNPIAIPAI